MKIVITMLNSKYIHSSLAPWYLLSGVRAYCDAEIQAEVTEATVNENISNIVSRLSEKNADIYAFCCYIWNIEMIKIIARRLKKVLPNTLMAFGGPEVSYDGAEFLRENPFADIIMKGEGEGTYKKLLTLWREGGNYAGIKGIIYRNGDEIIENENAEPMCLDDIPFVYDNADEFRNKII